MAEDFYHPLAVGDTIWGHHNSPQFQSQGKVSYYPTQSGLNGLVRNTVGTVFGFSNNGIYRYPTTLPLSIDTLLNGVEVNAACPLSGNRMAFMGENAIWIAQNDGSLSEFDVSSSGNDVFFAIAADTTSDDLWILTEAPYVGSVSKLLSWHNGSWTSTTLQRPLYSLAFFNDKLFLGGRDTLFQWSVNGVALKRWSTKRSSSPTDTIKMCGYITCIP